MSLLEYSGESNYEKLGADLGRYAGKAGGDEIEMKAGDTEIGT